MTAEVSRVTFEPINEKYSNARYGEFDVIMDMTTGYINATKLCAQGGKRFDNWLENKSSRELMKELEDTINLSLENNKKISISVSCGYYGYLRGRYVHPDLIPHIASWVSSKFAIKVSKIINEWVQASQENKNRYWNEMGDSFNQSKDINQNECRTSMLSCQVREPPNVARWESSLPDSQTTPPPPRQPGRMTSSQIVAAQPVRQICGVRF